MNYNTLIIEDQNGIITVTINRPQAMNALNAEVIAELGEFFSNVEHTKSSIKGIVITGAGEKAFVAGADIKAFQGIGSEEGKKLSLIGQQVFDMIEAFPRPVIAAVNGFALGGGCELAMSCHFRIASTNARFGQPEVNLGLVPGYGGTQRLPLLIGKGRAIELLITGDMINAQQALEWGLVNHVTESDALLGKAYEILEKSGSKAPQAIAHIIGCVNTTFGKQLDEGLRHEADIFGKCMDTEDFTEGVSAFIEKRKPSFSGK